MLYPYDNFDRRINEGNKSPELSGWKQNNCPFKATGDQLTSLSKDKKAFLFNVKTVNIDKTTVAFSTLTDVYIVQEEDTITIYGLGITAISMTIKGKTNNTILLKPGTKSVLSTKLKK
ncbi:hypothetical protein [Flavobacterium muglaense]|uniref:Uncharacterized protein n=1 Tax=Flavobacterium muglaense TaxID=2764716 RepID=A0A923MZ04_9FLAO|nr:hypothetical protein [Flavobacterium muglaense]MBC5837221.1 hypothetical protein [Flavobacterium muglaense]MBC5843750.1 hypothetical protein [Flavobacterium muglaense]